MAQQYSHSEMMAMQQDAIRRVQEMHRRSQPKIQNQSHHSRNNTHPSSQQKNQEFPDKKQNSQQPIVPAKPNEESPLSKILTDLNLDHDRIIILALIVLLLNEGGDKLLILALCYLLG